MITQNQELKMNKVFYTPITLTTIAKNGSERNGATAECFFWTEEKPLRINISQYGKTKKQAEQKLINFLSSNGTVEIKCVE